MTPHDQRRFAAFVAEFINDCGIDPPLHLVIVGANGAVSVAHYDGEGGVEEVCATLPGEFVAPPTLTVILRTGAANR